MPVIEIKGVHVKFPFEPYPVQRKYMETVIESLENGQNAILESPTGTGKTLCLLCATLAWVEKMRRSNKHPTMQQVGKEEIEQTSETSKQPLKMSSTTDTKRMDNVDEASTSCLNESSLVRHFFGGASKVIYASRTHSQITQAMNELKRTEYNYFKAGVIASRDQLCINEDLIGYSNADKTHACNALQKKKRPHEKCKYHENVSKNLNDPELQDNSILDIEDLGRIGTRLNCCPFYVSKEKIKNADIVFMPYNYLLDPMIRYATQIDLKNSIVILDEAHNVEKMCKDSAGTIITTSKIDIAKRDLDYIIQNPNLLQEENLPSIRIDDISELAAAIQNFGTEILNIVIKGAIKSDSHPGGYIFNLLERAGINKDNSEFIINILYSLSGLLSEQSKTNRTTGKKCPDGIGLKALQSFFRVVFSSSPNLRELVNKCYKVFVENEPMTQTRLSNNEAVDVAPRVNAKQINLWCFSPAFGMQYLYENDIRNLILTSGTLAPLEPLISEMQISRAIPLKNGHIVRPFQVCVKIVGYGPDQVLLDSSFKKRNDAGYLRSLGQTVLEFSKVVPDGLLLFFPSYPVMEMCKTSWKNNGTWQAINEQKRIFIEARTKPEFEEQMKGYYGTIHATDSNGAIFMAVLRGKVSEGLDFADMYGRAVIIVGIPFAPYLDPKVILEKKYLDENRTRENGMPSGNQWYVLDAIRAINQAIGRVIRHKDDYGAIFFCDNRFHSSRNKHDISKWIQDHLGALKAGEHFSSMIEDVRHFYENAKQKLPKPKPKLKPEVDTFDENASINEMVYRDDEFDVSFDGNVSINNNCDVGVSPAKRMKENACPCLNGN